MLYPSLLLFSLLLAHPLGRVVTLPVYALELRLKLLPPLYQICYLLCVEHVEELEDAYLAVLNPAEEREGEHADEGDDADRDEAD